MLWLTVDLNALNHVYRSARIFERKMNNPEFRINTVSFLEANLPRNRRSIVIILKGNFDLSSVGPLIRSMILN